MNRIKYNHTILIVLYYTYLTLQSIECVDYSMPL